MDELLAQFLVEARELVTAAADDIGALRSDFGNRKHLDSAFRAFHTLKGSVALFDMVPAGQVLHAAEELLDQARKQSTTLDDSKLASLLACLDRIDVWVDAMESHGALPDNAGAEAASLLQRLSYGGSAPLQSTSEMSDWLSTLQSRDFDMALIDAGGLTAFRYEPHEQCFFRGDDPLAIVATVPKLAGLRVMPRGAWPSLAEIQPFHCMMIVEGLSHASLDEVHLAFRLVNDQVKIAELPSTRDKRLQEITAAGSTRSLRVDSARIDSLVDGVGELVVAGNALAPLVNEALRIDNEFGSRLRQVQAAFERSIGDMTRSVTAMRMVPIGPAVRRLPRVVRDVSNVLGRDVDFTIEGEKVECEKGIADAIYEPLLHLIRNSIDHGIEKPETRIAIGKPKEGKIQLRFSRVADQLVTELEDDGAGIDPKQMRDLAVERKFLSADQAEALSDEEAQALIFKAGFSTAKQVSDISGRGVGMDAVMAALDPLGARIDVRSQVGLGTLVRISLPLSAITTRMLIVEAGAQRYAVPFESVAETVIVPTNRIVPLGDRHAVVLRDRTLPVVHLRELFGEERSNGSTTKLMITWAGNEQVAIAVDGFGERIEAMIKPASGLLAGYAGLSGVTLLGSGDVMLVLDVEALVA